MRIHGQTSSPGFFRKLLALVTGAILLVVGLLFSVVVLAFIAVVALLAGAYFWWNTRKLRQVIREPASYGQVIDGEVVVVDESAEEGDRNILPRDTPPG